MADNNSQTSTDAAKERSQQLVKSGGAPPVPAASSYTIDPGAIQGSPSSIPQQPGKGVPAGQFLNQGRQRRSPQEIQRDLEDLARAQEQMKAQLEAAQAEEQASPEPEPEPEPEEDEERDYQKDLYLTSPDDEMMAALDKFSNPARRRKIEKKLKKMVVEDLVTQGELRQEVPISAGIKVTYRTTSGMESQGILQELGKAAINLSASDMFLRERLALMNLAVGIYAVGTEVYPSHLVDDEFNTEAFEKKLNKILKLPNLVLADMRVNYFWFDERVKDIMVAEELGNG